MKRPTEEEIRDRLDKTTFENPCTTGTSEFQDWRRGFVAGARGEGCPPNLNPAFTEGYEAGDLWAKSQPESSDLASDSSGDRKTLRAYSLEPQGYAKAISVDGELVVLIWDNDRWVPIENEFGDRLFEGASLNRESVISVELVVPIVASEVAEVAYAAGYKAAQADLRKAIGL
jgi:hypothetical protein